MKDFPNLSDISVGETAIIYKINHTGPLRRRLMDLGLIENCHIECVGKSALGDPLAFSLRGFTIAIRKDDLKKILVYPYKK